MVYDLSFVICNCSKTEIAHRNSEVRTAIVLGIEVSRQRGGVNKIQRALLAIDYNVKRRKALLLLDSLRNADNADGNTCLDRTGVTLPPYRLVSGADVIIIVSMDVPV